MFCFSWVILLPNVYMIKIFQCYYISLVICIKKIFKNKIFLTCSVRPSCLRRAVQTWLPPFLQWFSLFLMQKRCSLLLISIPVCSHPDLYHQDLSCLLYPIPNTVVSMWPFKASQSNHCSIPPLYSLQISSPTIGLHASSTFRAFLYQ